MEVKLEVLRAQEGRSLNASDPEERQLGQRCLQPRV